MEIVISEAEEKDMGTPLAVLSVKDGSALLWWRNDVGPEKIADYLRVLGIDPAKCKWLRPGEGVSL